MRQSLVLFLVLATGLCAASPPAGAAGTREFIAGADISMLPEIEKAGGVFRRADGTPGDAIAILRDHGINLFRVRLFVNPTTDFAKSYGATQNLDYVTALA